MLCSRFLHIVCKLALPIFSSKKKKIAHQGGGAVKKRSVHLQGHFYFELQGAENVTEEDSKPYPVGGKEEEEEYDNVEDFHSCGIGRFRLFEGTLICVDGQQRLTTTSLLVAAIRWSGGLKICQSEISLGTKQTHWEKIFCARRQTHSWFPLRRTLRWIPQSIQNSDYFLLSQTGGFKK